MKPLIYPYPTLGYPLTLTVENITIDERPLRSGLLDSENRLVALYKLETEIRWNRLAFDVSARAAATDLTEWRSEAEDPAVHVLALCRPTNVRQSLLLKPMDTDPNCWTGRMELDRDNFRDRMALRSVLTSRVGGVSHRPCGFSGDWSFHFDEPLSLRLRGAMRIVWISFKDANSPALCRAFENAPYVIDLNEEPTLYLNQDLPGLEALLGDRTDRTMGEKALHDLERLSIARSVWTVLVMRSVLGIQEGEDGADPEWPTIPWQEEVLKQYLGKITQTTSDAEGLRLLVNARSRPDHWDALLAQIEAVVGEEVVHPKLRMTLRNLQRGEE